jgi:hypothetical protein
MKWAALITWVLTAGGGFAMLALWLGGGGMRQSAQSRVISPPLILGHFSLAVVGLVLWIVYLASDTDALAWIAFGLLLVVALAGFTMLAIWLQQRRGATAVAPADAGATTAPPAGAPGAAGARPAPGPGAAPGRPAEQRFPIPIVSGHGLLAATTLVLVLLTAAGVGD